MKYQPIQYAKAFSAVWNITPDSQKIAVEKKFIELLKKNGDILRAEKILNAIEEHITRTQGNNLITLEFARPLDTIIIASIKKHFSENDRVRTIINPNLIAGIRITINGAIEFDNTVQRKLLLLFK